MRKGAVLISQCPLRSRPVRSAAIGAVTYAVFAASLPLTVAAQDAEATGGADTPWKFTVGGGPLAMPEYEGAKHYTVSGLPTVGVSWRDTVSLSATDGLMVTLRPLPDQGFFVSGGVGYWLGRKEGADKEHGDALRGLGNLSGNAIGKLDGGYRYGPFAVGLNLAQDLGGDRDGATVTPYLAYRLYHDQRFTVNTTLSATWASAHYMQHMFGITAQQSAASLDHYASYSAGAGVKDATLRLDGIYRLTPSVWLFAMTSVSRLLSDAADSPIVKDQGSPNQFSGSVGLTYRF